MVVEVGETDCVPPLVDLLPVKVPPLAVQEVALVTALQVRVLLPPLVILVGFAESMKEGAGVPA